VNRVVPNTSLSLNKHTERNQNIGTKIFGIHTHGDILVPVFWFVSVCLFRLKGLFGTTLLHFFHLYSTNFTMDPYLFHAHRHENLWWLDFGTMPLGLGWGGWKTHLGFNSWVNDYWTNVFIEIIKLQRDKITQWSLSELTTWSIMKPWSCFEARIFDESTSKYVALLHATHSERSKKGLWNTIKTCISIHSN